MFHFHVKQMKCNDQKRSNHATDLSQKPGSQKAKQHGIVGLAVKPWHADATVLPQLALPAVQRPGGEADINQNDIGAAFNEPAAKVNLWEHGESCRCEGKTILLFKQYNFKVF